MKLCFDNPDNEEYQSEWHPFTAAFVGGYITVPEYLGL